MSEVTFHGHSAVTVRSDGQQLFVDPGGFSDLTGLADASAILVTHAHPDHMSVAALAEVTAPVWAPQDAIAQLEQAGVPADRLHAVAPGESFEAAGVDVSVRGGEHAQIYPGIPTPHNNAYLIGGRLLHPGDSLPPVPELGAVRFLLLPVAAPWLKLSEALDYATQYEGIRIAPIHDAILSPAGKGLVDTLFTRLLGEDAYARIEEGRSLEL